MRNGLSLAISQPRGIAGGAPLPWLLVATRCRLGSTFASANKQGMSRSTHVAKDNITALKIVVPNFKSGAYLASPSGDVTIGSASATVTASVEYPAGTFTQILFSGSATGTIADLAILASDAATVSIPTGSTFWIRIYWQSTAGIFYAPFRDTAGGDLYRVGASGITDQTMSGTITHNAGTACYFPAAILAQTSIDSYVICGDSIAAGYTDTEGATGDNLRGVIARSIPSSAPFINIAQSGEKASNFLTNGFLRKLMVPYGKHLITEYGRNDLNASDADATIRSNILAIWALGNPGGKRYQATITPQATSTDSFATTANQTPVNNEPTFNALVRAGTGFTGITGYIEIADILNPNRDGKWVVTPTPPYTADGLHPNPAGYGLTSSAVWTTF